MRHTIAATTILALVATVLFTTSPAQGQFTAYNDCVHGGSPPNTTIYSAYMGDGGGFEDPNGFLKDFTTGLYTSVWVELTGSNITGSISAAPNAGTDAYDVFNSKVNLGDWSTSYNSSSLDWYYEVTFTGLDPSKSYEFVTTGNRNSSSYDGNGSASRWTKFSIIGADAYTNASTPGVVEVSADVVKFNTGYNTVNGYVARWTGIRSGADGSFSVRSENVGADGPGEPNKSYGMEGFMLVESAGGPPGPVHNLDTDEYFATIQAAIDDPDTSDGHTIEIAAGTYNENAIHVNKALTIVGAGMGDGAGDTIINGGAAVALYPDVDDITITDLRIQEATQAVRFEKTGATIDNTELARVALVNNTSRGIEIHNATTVTNLRIIDSLFDNNVVGIRLASSAMGDGITITGTTFQNHSDPDSGIGFYQANDGSTGIVRNLHVDDCTFTDSGFAALYMEEAQDVLVENSVFSGNARDFYIWKAYSVAPVSNVVVRHNDFLGSTSRAVALGFYGPDAVQGVSVVENNIIGGLRALSFDADPTTTGIDTIHVNRNSFVVTGDELFAYCYEAGESWVLDLSNNFWGGTDPSLVTVDPYVYPDPSCSATAIDMFDFTPMIDSGVDLDGGVPGFVPDLSALTVHAAGGQSGASGRIQEAVDLVTGSTVNMAPGTYEEQVHVTTDDVDIVGSGSGDNPTVDSIIRSPASLTWYFTTSGNNYPIVGFDGVTGGSLQDLRVDGLGRGNANYRFVGVGFWNAGGDIADCVITNIQDTPFSGAQHGVGIYAYNSGGGPYTINVSGTTVDEFQKTAMALSGDNLTANVLDCAVVGEGATGITAQNGIQIGFGAGGTVSDCSVSGIGYTGTNWGASGMLFYQGTDVDVTGTCSVTDCQGSVVYQETDGSVSGVVVNADDIDSAEGISVRDYGYALGSGGLLAPPPVAPFDETLSSDGGLRGAATSVSVSDVTLIGTHHAGTYGVAVWSLGDNVTATITGSTIQDWEIGVVAYEDGSTVAVTANNDAITSNDWGFWTNAAAIQDAEDNWWGSAEGPEDGAGASEVTLATCDTFAVNDMLNVAPLGGLGDPVNETDVDYCPWLASYPRLSLEADSDCYDLGETVTVEIWMHDIAQTIVGGQFFLEYDNTVLNFAAMTPGGTPFTNEIYEVKNESLGTIDYAVGIPDGGTGVSGDARLAVITFTALQQICRETDLVTWRTHWPPTRLGDSDSQPVYPPLDDMDIIDDQPPLIGTQPSGSTVECDGTGISSQIATWLANEGGATASDNCGDVAWSNDFDSGDFVPVCGGTGYVDVTFTATDDCGNSSDTDTVRFTIADTTAPTIDTQPSASTVECDGTGISSQIAAWLAGHGGAAASDVCSGPVTWSDDFVVGNFVTTCGGAGYVDVMFTATDDCGNGTNTDTVTFTIVDTTAPVVTAPMADTVECDGSGNTAELNAWLASATAADACEGALTTTPVLVSDVPGCGGTHVYTYEWTATDSCSNTGPSAQSTFTIEDTVAPDVTCSNVVVPADAGDCTATVTLTATASDDCDGTVPVSYEADLGSGYVPIANPYTFPPGTTPVRAYATDGCSHTGECFFTVDVLGVSELVVNVELKDVTEPALTRCIAFELWDCTSMTSQTVEEEITFSYILPSGPCSATGVTIDVPCGSWDCVRARDPLHTLWRTDVDGFGISGTQFVASFTDDSGMSGDDDSLIGGNIFEDGPPIAPPQVIDILDYAVFVNYWGADYGTGDTTCATTRPHADISGNGTVNTADFTFIQTYFLSVDDAGCCGLFASGGSPRASISVAELVEMGLGELSGADLNNDGWVDELDIIAFAQGVRPPAWPRTVEPEAIDSMGAGAAEPETDRTPRHLP